MKTLSQTSFFFALSFERIASYEFPGPILLVLQHLPRFLFQLFASQEEATPQEVSPSARFKCPFINCIPYTFACLIYITVFFRGHSSAWSVSHPFRTFHWTYECCFLKQTVSAHPATKQRSLDKKLSFCENPPAEFFPLKRIKGWLPSAGRFYTRHIFNDI